MRIRDIEWSPDGQHIAYRVQNDRDGEYNNIVYRIPASGGTPQQLASNTATVDLDQPGTMSWSNTGQLAMLGYLVTGPKAPRTEAILTVPATGGPIVVRSSVPLCEESFPCWRFEGGVDWSSDGERVLTAMTDRYNGSYIADTNVYAVEVPPGAGEPTVLAAFPPVDETDFPAVAAGIGYSPDQTGGFISLLTGDGYSGPRYYNYTFTRAGAAIPRPSGIGDSVRDWQPCPNGTCPNWLADADTDLDLDPEVSVSTSGKRGDIGARSGHPDLIGGL